MFSKKKICLYDSDVVTSKYIINELKKYNLKIFHVVSFMFLDIYNEIYEFNLYVIDISIKYNENKKILKKFLEYNEKNKKTPILFLTDPVNDNNEMNKYIMINSKYCRYRREHKPMLIQKPFLNVIKGMLY